MDTQPPPEKTSEPVSGPASEPTSGPQAESTTGPKSEPTTQSSGPPEGTPPEGTPTEGTGPKKERRRRVPRAVVVIAALLVLGVILLDMIWDETDDQAAPSLAPTASVAPSPTASETLEPPTLPPAAPTGIQAEAAAFEVLVTWEPGTGEGADPAAYQISRDGELLETVGVDELSFRDADVLPATSYEYEVAAIDADGVTSAEVATVSAETESVPLSAARLSGTFDMGLKETSHFGYDTFGTAPTEQRWRFVPKCGSGPCAVKFSAEGVRDSSTQLARAAGSYEGSYRSTAFVSCAGVPSTTAVSIRFEVTRAAVVDGEWRATKIAGSLVHREAPQLSCVASGTDFTVAGTLVQG